MTSTNKYADTKAIDYLESIKRNQLESRNARSSMANFLMKYNFPVPTNIDVVTSFTNTEKTLGDYDITDNTSKLVCYIPFDYDILDASNSNDGILTGTETWVSGPEIRKVGMRKALSFNGSTNYVTLTNESNFDFEHTNTFSVSFWIKMGSINADQGLVVKSNDLTTGSGWKIYFQNTSDLIVFKLANGTNIYSVSSTTSLSTTKWNHVVCTFSGNSNQTGMKIYVNGVLEAIGASSTISGTILNNVSVVLGAESDAGSLLTGYMDELQIWNTELTSSDVIDLYAGKQICFILASGNILAETGVEIETESSVVMETDHDTIKPAVLGFSDVT